ncbi:MAG: SwmB domain-containing protein [Balneola sp.]
MSISNVKYQLRIAGLILAGFLFFLSTENATAQVVVNETTLVSDSYTVSADGRVTITIVGADGGNGSNTDGGEGATVVATFDVDAGDVIRYVVGEAGNTHGGSSAGGGGSTGVYINDVLVMVAGAGGGGDNSNGAVGLGGNTTTGGDSGSGGGPGAGGTNGNGGGATTTTTASGGGGGINSNGGSGNAGGGARSDNTTSNPAVDLSIANGGSGNGTGSAGGRGFSGGGGADANYGAGGAGYSGGGAGGSNGGGGGGGSFVHSSAISSNFTAGGDGAGNESDGSIEIFYTNDTNAPSAPQNVTALALIGGDIQISFDDVDEAGSGVASYSVKRGTATSGPYTEIGTVTDNESASYTYTDNNAVDGTTYFYVVTAIDNANNESVQSNEASATSDGTAPLLETVTVNGATLILDYDENLDNSSVPVLGDYVVNVNSSTVSVTNVSINNDQITITISSAVNFGDNVTLDYTAGSNPVRDVVGNQSANLSNQTVTNNTPDNTPPGTPQNISASAIAGGGITINFDDVDESTGSGVTTYSVKRATSSGGPYSQIGTVSDNESISYTFTDNTPVSGTTYYYVVSAIDGSSNESGNSAEVSATADGISPELDSVIVKGEKLTLYYDEPIDISSAPANSDYDVSVNSSNNPVSSLTISGNQVILTLSNVVQPGDNVELDYTPGINKIRDNVGNLASSLSNQAVTNQTAGFTPTPPQDVQAKAVSDGDIEISFLDVGTGGQIATYSVKRSTSQGGSYSQVGTVTDNESASYTFTDNTAVNGTTYYYVVTSLDGSSGESGISSEVNAVSDDVAPLYETSLVGGSSLLLDYDEILDASSVPATTDFEVRVNGSQVSISSISITNVRVNIELTNAIQQGDNITFDYTPGTNRIRDLATNNAAAFTGTNAINYTSTNIPFGPDPCPIINGNDASWACFDGTNNSTTISAKVGNVEIATVDAQGGTQTTFSPNALQEWSSGAFSGDQFNGPQVNASGNTGNATSFDINIADGIPSDAFILSLNKLRPNSGNTSYTLEAFDGANTKIALNGWVTGQGVDGGVCTNSVNLNYTNANTTIEFQPVVSGNPSCTSSSNAIWFRINTPGVERIEIRKIVANTDNIHVGLALVADYGDAPNSYRTTYNSRGNDPAFHILSNTGTNPVYFGGTVDADGNGAAGSLANGDDSESSGIGSGDDEDAITILPVLRTNYTEYDVDLVCTSGAKVGGWLDLNQNGTFDNSEYAFTECVSGVANLSWNGISGLITGDTFARFRIASQTSSVASPYGIAVGGEVEDYGLSIQEPATPDLEIDKVVDNSTPVQGETITYTVSVTNPGEFEATNVQVTDDLPNGITYQSHSASQGTYNTSTNLWNIGSLAEGDTTTVTLTIIATVNSGTEGNTITNNAEITQLNENDPELNNNSASAGITVVSEASDIQVLKIVDNSVPIEGDFINYTISVTNQGPRDASNLKIIDQLPSGVIFQSANPSVGTYNNSTGIWDIGTFVNGASASLVINVRVDQNTEGSTIANTAAVQTLDQNDPNNSNNSSTVNITVDEASAPTSCNDRPLLRFTNYTLESGTALQLGAVYKFDSVLPGVYARIEIITDNNATITDIDQTSGTTAFNEAFSPRIQSANGQDAFMDFEISFYDSVTNVEKYLSFAATSSDVDGTGGSLKEYVGFQNLSSYTIESTTDLVIGSAGIYATYTPDNFNGVTSTDPDFSDHTVYSAYTNEPKFKFRAGIQAGGSTSNRLYRLSFDPCEINNFNDPVSENIIDVSVTKAVDNVSPSVGDTVSYTITAKNEKGNAVGNVEVTDQLPAGLTFVSGTTTLGTYANGTGIWNIGTLSGLQSATLTLKATVNTGQEGNTIKNTASFSNFTGGDGNQSNNSAEVDIIVFDPSSGLTCSEPPLFNFSSNTLEQGIAGQVNAVYRFNNIASGLDALVRIKAISNATLSNVDNNASGNSAANFSPLFRATQSGGYIDWEVKFVATGTTNPVKKNFAMTALDIDGFVNQNDNTQTIRDFLGFTQNQSNSVQGGNNLTETTSGAFQFFTSTPATDGNGSLDFDHMAYIKYNYTSIFDFRTGSNTTNGYSIDRLVDIDFVQCRNQDFDPEVVTTRDADISVTKTVDNANPLENESINFTITVTNNGPERATEVDVNETLPAGLALVQATPSQGTYNQITKTWAIGTLNNGSSVTMSVEATVNAGVTADSLVNKAFLLGLNQFDPNQANDTSKVAIYISNKVEGIVFRDKTGNGITDGDTNFGDASGDQQAVKDVIVHLFKDGGDGLADGSDDIFLRSDTTNISGAFTFQVGEDADYWIAVNSKTGNLTNGSSWAEQVYAPSGALCSDGNGGAATKASDGNCFGGRRGNQSDNLPVGTDPSNADLANAEHVAKFTMASNNISGLNFGFSFNVVTDTRDGDDDLSSNRSIQGSLRQFITNANEISGANTMRFVPSVATNETGSGGNWWKITLSSELPAITDPLTTLDGRSFNLNSPLSILNPNSGSVGTGGSVGIDGISLNTFERKELEVDLNDVGNNALSINSTGAVVLRHFALFNNTRSVSLANIAGGTIENNMIGTRADGTDPTGLNQSDLGILITGSGSQTPLIQRNYIAYTKDSGVRSENGNATIQFTKNEVYRAGSSANNADGLEGIGTWSITQNLFHENGKSNGSDVYGGSGIEIGNSSGSATTGNTIRNNTIKNHKTTGINILNQVSSTLIEKNIITGNGTDYSSAPYKGAGVRLSFPDAQPQQGIYITKNSFSNNKGLAIDIVTSGNGEADGVSPNDGVIESASTEPNRGLDYPVFTLATIDGNQLTVEGYIGKNATRLSGVYTIEIYKAADDGNQQGLTEEGGTLIRPHGEGQTLIGTINTNANGSFSETITVSSTSIVINDRITSLAYDGANNTSEFSTNQRVVATGVTINGYVYKDDNHNTLREGNEVGLQNVTIVLYNKSLNSCKSVLTDANGFYQFSNVLNGEYDLIESVGQSVPTPDVCTPPETDPVDYVSTTPNLRTLLINNLPAQMNFGDFEGSRVEGVVFADNGIGGGTANDGIKNGNEIGLENTAVKALTGSNTLVEQTTTNGAGEYILYVPKSVVGSGGTVKIQEVNNTSFITTGGDAGDTGGSYDISTDISTFTNTVGTSYTSIDFADVAESIFLTDGSQSLQPGATAFFQHTFEAKTDAAVAFTTSSVNNPSNITWPVVLYNDLNCNGSVNSGEPIIQPNDIVNVTTGQTVCLLLRVTVPQGVSNGASSNTTILAVMDYNNTSPVIQQSLSRTDLVTVSDQEAGLVLTKSVDQAQALPGATLSYSVSYVNNGDEPISSLEITDNTPTYTTFSSANCGSLPNNLTDCTITSPSVGAAGGIKWTFTGTLQPGGTGVVTFTVKIDN